MQTKMANSIKISNEKAFTVYKEINGPIRRRNSRGGSDMDLKLTSEILEKCEVCLVNFENVSFCLRTSEFSVKLWLFRLRPLSLKSDERPLDLDLDFEQFS